MVACALLMLNCAFVAQTVYFSPRVAGKTSSAMFPGSNYVYDRDAKKLVPCTAEICNDKIIRNGTVRYINRAPHASSSTYLTTISAGGYASSTAIQWSMSGWLAIWFVCMSL